MRFTNSISRVLAMFVGNTMGGVQIDDVAAPNEIEKLASEVITYVKKELDSNVVRDIALVDCNAN